MSKLSDRLEAAEHLSDVLRSPDGDEVLDALNRFAAAIAREAEERAANAHLLTPHPPS